MVARIDMLKAKMMKAGPERDNKIKGAIFLHRILDSNSIITMSMSAGASCPYNFANGFVHMANGNILKSLKSYLVGVQAPALPKDNSKNKESTK